MRCLSLQLREICSHRHHAGADGFFRIEAAACQFIKFGKQGRPRFRFARGIGRQLHVDVAGDEGHFVVEHCGKRQPLPVAQLLKQSPAFAIHRRFQQLNGQ